MARKGGSKEGFSNDPSMSMPSEQKTNESNKIKISRIHDTFPSATKDNIAKILQFYADDESQAIDAITRDGGREALSSFAETGSLKSKNNKNKKKKKKPKKDAVSGLATTASFDADDSSSLHSSGNVDAELDKECQRVENGNGFFPDVADEIENINTTLTNHERLQDNEEPLSLNLETRSAISTPDQEVSQSPPDSSSDKFKEPFSYNKSTSPPRKREVESPPCASPLSDNSEKLDEQESKRDKSRQGSDHYKHTPRQRTSSFRRSKTSSLSEDSSSQHNSQSLAAKRGIDKCRKDLNRQTISLQRINSQVEKGLEESAKKIKNVFGDLQKQLDNRKKEVELELEKRKGEALQLIKSRQELAVELKRRVDRSPSMTDGEWNELRSDIKLFVTERKYDEDIGKTIWFQWADISDSIKSFGEVQPVKNAYSQRSSSVATSTEAAQNNPEPSPESSLVNEGDYAADKSDVAATASSNPVEEETFSTTKEDETSAFKNKPNETRTFNRVYSNSNKRFPRYSNNNFPNRFQGNRGGGYNQRPFNRNFNRYPNEDYRQQHPYQGRDNRTNENQSYAGNDRNMNNYYRKNDRGRGQHNTRYNHNQYPHQHRHQNRQHNTDNAAAPTEPTLKAAEPKPTVVNGVENN